MRRRAGVGAIQRQKVQQDKFKEKGSEIHENQLEQMTNQMEKFRENLEEFAAKHKNEIKKNPQFRKQFQEMCASIGVDPLASGKGFWSEMLGVGDFYYELGVQVIEVCVATSHRNGGVVAVEEVLKRLNQRRRHDNQISSDDVVRAVKKLKVLGSGMEITSSGTSQFIHAIPGELSMDHTTLLIQAKKDGHVTEASICSSLGWTSERSIRTLEHLLRAGVAWQDDQSKPVAYWFPAFFDKAQEVEELGA
ncbi:unnamed protein product [Meganyctiphanes norvegica]|uniref:Vacuolar-sorting protein SNF8 n=1 Tax=Meganyctiphanes norvegica TaxID=48144 RepID=A0AAV2RJB0_MEGNR